MEEGVVTQHCDPDLLMTTFESFHTTTKMQMITLDVGKSLTMTSMSELLRGADVGISHKVEFRDLNMENLRKWTKPRIF